MKNPGKKSDKLRKSESKEHETTNEEQWIHDINEEFAEDIPPVDDDFDFDDDNDDDEDYDY